MCSLFGILDYSGSLSANERYAMLRSLGIACEERGTDASGIACYDGSKLLVQKAPRPMRRLRFRLPQEARYIMGHTRMATQGDEKRNYNNHPFTGRVGNTTFALAHNGIIQNDRQLQKLHLLPVSKIETDSYVAVQLLEQHKKLSADSLRQVAELLEGSFTITVLSEAGLDIIRGNNPLSLYHFRDMGLYVYASTGDLLHEGLRPFASSLSKYENIALSQGEIAHIDTRGNISTSLFDDSHLFPTYFGFRNYECGEYGESRSEYMQSVLEYASSLGIPDDEMTLLCDAGFDPMDLEELVYDDDLRERCLNDILCDYGCR